ncbi:MAG: pyridoxamine kinase [Oscillospiraceae bacterium]|nr:pyridoxamine kinase [Oscillospiraceae bacterium]
MTHCRILTIQDISCVGQCSLTVALPIISACGIECAILPSAVLSTHTAGFTGFTCRDLTDDIPAIAEHWRKEGIDFAAVYTGYLGSEKQIDYVCDIFDTLTAPGGKKIVDPAMADNGKLYPAFDDAYVAAMRKLCAKADFLLPNITEAAFLTGMEYRTEYDRAYIDALLQGLTGLGAKNIILTGVSYAPGRTGVVVYENERYAYYEHEMLPNSCHGTGDIYASAFVGALMRGKCAFDAASIAADFTVACIEATAEHKNHWYGAIFEGNLPILAQKLH